MLFGLSHREKRVKKINLLHFLVFTSKNFVILMIAGTVHCFITNASAAYALKSDLKWRRVFMCPTSN